MIKSSSVMFLLTSIMLYSVDKSSAITVIMQATCQLLGILFKMNCFLKNGKGRLKDFRRPLMK